MLVCIAVSSFRAINPQSETLVVSSVFLLKVDLLYLCEYLQVLSSLLMNMASSQLQLDSAWDMLAQHLSNPSSLML